MTRLLFVTILATVALLASAALAQTPEPPTPTNESPVPTALPNEIVFMGKIIAPFGTSVTAAFYAITTENVGDIICASAITTAVDDPQLSAFILRVGVDCAGGRALRHICWGKSRCYVYMADPPRCSAFECAWSATVHPGTIVDFGLLPPAGPNEILFTGQVPAQPGTTVTAEFLDPVTLGIITCATATTAPTDDPTASRFVLAATVQCAVIGFPPRFCWGNDLCALYIEDDPRITNLVGGTTIELGLLTALQFGTPTPLPAVHGDGGPEALPPTGRGHNLDDGLWPRRLIASTLVLFAVGLVVGAFSLALRRVR